MQVSDAGKSGRSYAEIKNRKDMVILPYSKGGLQTLVYQKWQSHMVSCLR